MLPKTGCPVGRVNARHHGADHAVDKVGTEPPANKGANAFVCVRVPSRQKRFQKQPQFGMPGNKTGSDERRGGEWSGLHFAVGVNPPRCRPVGCGDHLVSQPKMLQQSVHCRLTVEPTIGGAVHDPAIHEVASNVSARLSGRFQYNAVHVVQEGCRCEPRNATSHDDHPRHI